MSTCAYCEAETPDGVYLCHDDARALTKALGRVSDVLHTARDTLTNMSVGNASVGGGGASAGSAAPIHLGMMDNLDTYAAVLGGWTRTLTGDQYGPREQPDTPAGNARTLTRRLPSIRLEDWAGDLLDELLDAERDIVQAADRVTPKVTLGACGRLWLEEATIVRCPGTVKAHEGYDRAVCDSCQEVTSAAERRAGILAEAWHVLAPLPQIVKALNAAGHKLKYDTAKKWVTRGKIAPICDIATRQEGVSAAAVLNAMG